MQAVPAIKRVPVDSMCMQCSHAHTHYTHAHTNNTHIVHIERLVVELSAYLRVHLAVTVLLDHLEQTGHL